MRLNIRETVLHPALPRKACYVFCLESILAEYQDDTKFHVGEAYPLHFRYNFILVVSCVTGLYKTSSKEGSQ